MRISEHTFENQDVVLDFHEYDNCTFSKCRVIINGVGRFNLIKCQFTDCKFEFCGPAAMTLQALTDLYHGGFQPLVEATLQNIRKGSHPKNE